MLKNWMHDITLAVQARSGVTPSLLVWLGVIVIGSVTAFAFLCVAAYDWLALELNAVAAGLIMAGIFVLVAVLGAVLGASARRRAKERAILERAARAHAAPSWLLDPKILGVAVKAGRALGWERIIPVALLGFLAAQWARERHQRDPDVAD
jgi:hypothetical protein